MPTTRPGWAESAAIEVTDSDPLRAYLLEGARLLRAGIPELLLELRDVKQTLETAKANADSARPGFMDHAFTFLNLAKGQLFTANPDNEF